MECHTLDLFTCIHVGSRPSESTPPNCNLYSLRVYRSPPETTGDRLCVVVVSLFQRVFFDVRAYLLCSKHVLWAFLWHMIFFQFLKKFEEDILPHEYRTLSKDRADRTIEEPLSLANMNAAVRVVCDSSWKHMVDKRLVSICKILGTKLRIVLFRYPKKLWIFL